MTATKEKQLRLGPLENLLNVYGGLGSGRLIILGEPGAGKSSTGIRLLCDALDHRAGLTDPQERARVPVPVLVTPQGWDLASGEPFTEWLADRLARDYALLRAPEYGEDAALHLVKRGYLTVILDGLDEIPQALRSRALGELEKQVGFRLVVLTRREELVAVASGHHLWDAAALELEPIGSRQAAEYLANYLASCSINPIPAPWGKLIGHLQEHPDGILAQVLNTPLMLTLVRDTYGPEGKVDELINAEIHRSSSRKATEDRLLNRVLTTAYPEPLSQLAPRYTGERARQWLGRLAHRMNEEGARDLAWWVTPRWVPAWPRVLSTVAVISVVSAILIGSLTALAGHMDFFSIFLANSRDVLVPVFAKTFGYACMFGAGLLVTSPPVGRPLQRRSQHRWSRADVLTILTLGVGVGAAVGVEVAVKSGPIYGFAIGLVSSVVVSLGFILGGGPPQQLGKLRWHRTDIYSNLVVGFVVGLIAGLIAGLGYGLGYGLKFGVVFGSIVGVGYMLVIVVGGRSSPQRSQLQASGTDTLTTLLIGFVIAVVSAGGYGVIYVFILVLSGRSPLQRSRLRWSRITTVTTLFTGLAAGLAVGPAFGLAYWLTYGGQFASNFGLALLTGGLGFGLLTGLLLGLRQPPTEATSPLDPKSMWRRELQIGLAFGIVFGLVFELTGALANSMVHEPRTALTFAIAGGIVFGLGSGLVSSVTWATALANIQLHRRGDAPARMLRFLDNAREHQILRTIGPTYQFRDKRLRELLAEEHKPAPGGVSYRYADHLSATSQPPD